MTGSRLMHWILCCLVAAASVAGCTSDATSNEMSGSLELNLEVGNVEIDEVDYLITGNGMDPMGGTIDTSAPGSTASVEVFGLLPGDYTVTLSATATDGETMCEGSEDFSVETAELTELMVFLRCKRPEHLGGVRVNGKFNVCAVVEKSVVKPLQTSVGNDIDLSAMGEDAEGDNITYIWSGTGGDIDDPNAMDTTYTCEEEGKHSVTITVSDDGFEYCMDSWTTVVTCVKGDIGLCDLVVCKPDLNECTETNCDPSDGICKDEPVDDGTDCKDGVGMCMDGECVDNNLCEGKDCSDGKECTDDSCNPLTGNCINAPVDDGTDCADGTGMCVGGECIAEDLCDGVTCEDTGNECTVGVCNMQTGNCDPMDVEPGTPCNDGAGACAGGECLDNNLCDTVDCTSSNDCMQDGTCNPLNGECIPGDDEPLGTPCADGVCDGQGTCLGCNVPDDCTGDLGQCEAKACINDACSIVIIMDGAPCDLAGAGDGVCDAGTCVEATECNSPGDCDDSNVCTTESCVDGMCGYDPNNGAECDAGGLPGLCEAGACVGLCEGVTCPDLGECMTNECNTSTGDCDASDVDDGTSCQDGAGECTGGECAVASECASAANCVACNDGAGVCLDGVCDEGLAFTNTFALGGAFRAFNGLLPSDAVCSMPDLEFPNVPGSSMPVPSDIGTQCVNVPGVAGQLTFSDQGGGNLDIDGLLDLDFTINAIIPSPFAQVLIVTSSSTVYTGTGIGTLDDGMYVRPQPAVTPGNPFDETPNMTAGTACNCEAIRDPDGNVAAFVPCGPNDGGAGTQRCEVDGELCVKPQAGQFFPGACETGTTVCSAAALDFAGDACGCADGLCVSGGEACTSCGAGDSCTVTSDCPAFASGSTCVSNVCTAPPGGVCDVLGGNPCSLSTDCPLNSAGQVCEFTGDPAIGTPGTCSALFGPGAVASGFCGNPGQTCTAAVCDPVGNPGGGAFCGQAFGQACLGGICQAVDLSDALCPLANLQGGLNYTPLPNDPLERSWGSLLFTTDNTTCGLGMVMDRDELGTGGPSVASGWFVSNPPPLASDGTQFVGMTGTQQ